MGKCSVVLVRPSHRPLFSSFFKQPSSPFLPPLPSSPLRFSFAAGAVNGMFWCRGSDVEYDAWNTLNPNGTQDWGWSEMTKYINKAETYHPPTDEQIAASGYVGDASAHGTDGPIQAGYSAFWYEGVNNWIPSWKALGFEAIDGAGGESFPFLSFLFSSFRFVGRAAAREE